MSKIQAFITILIIAAVSFCMKGMPFFIFGKKKSGEATTSNFVAYLGAVLPYALMGMLVVYCFKGVSIVKYPYGLPELIAGLYVLVIHKWKHNLVLSIGGGTVLYMVLLRVFNLFI